MNETASIDDFLAGCLRFVRAGGAASWSLGAELDWQLVWSRIEYHGIAFLLNTHAQRLSDWPQALLDRLSEEARLIAMWEATHHQAICKVLDALSNAGIETVIMKGTALAYSLHEEPATRRRGDTDLLVSPKNRELTRALLQDLGWYRKQDAHGIYYQESWLHEAAGFFVHAIDLHWEPSDRPALQAILPISEFFDDRRSLPDLHRAAFRPEPALMIIHGTINQKWHALLGYHAESGRVISQRRLIWSLDLSLLCESMRPQDWARLEAHCRTHGIGPLIAEALRTMQLDTNYKLPADHLAKLEASPFDETLEKYFARLDSLSHFWIDLKRANSLSERGRLLMMRAFPPREHLLEKYPAAIKWPTAFLQGRLLIETAGRALRKVGPR